MLLPYFDVIVTESVAHTVLAQRQFIICAVTLLVTLPLSFYKNIAKLSKVSVFSLTAPSELLAHILELWSNHNYSVIAPSFLIRFISRLKHCYWEVNRCLIIKICKSLVPN